MAISSGAGSTGVALGTPKEQRPASLPTPPKSLIAATFVAMTGLPVAKAASPARADRIADIAVAWTALKIRMRSGRVTGGRLPGGRHADLADVGGGVFGSRDGVHPGTADGRLRSPARNHVSSHDGRGFLARHQVGAVRTGSAWRALYALNIDGICANTPAAKGRVERALDVTRSSGEGAATGRHLHHRAQATGCWTLPRSGC